MTKIKALSSISLVFILSACSTATELMDTLPKFQYSSPKNSQTIIACINEQWERNNLMFYKKALDYKPVKNGGSLAFVIAGLVPRTTAVIKVTDKTNGGSHTAIHAAFQFGFDKSHPLVIAAEMCNKS